MSDPSPQPSPTPAGTTETDVINLIGDRLGPDAKKAAEAMRADPEVRKHLLFIGSTPLIDGEHALEEMDQCLHDKAPAEQIPPTLRQILAAVAVVMTLRNIPPDKVQRRPKEDGLIEALTDFAATKDGQPAKMANVEADTARLRWLIRYIGIGRNTFRVASRFTQYVLSNVADWEVEAFTTMQEGYKLVRPVALSDEVLNDLLERVELYLFGSAKQGVLTAKDNKKTKDKLQTEADKKAMGSARKVVGNEIAGEISALADELRRTAPEPPPPPPPHNNARNQAR